ncbi:MAG: PAS domain S-box protein, partial [Armatimonadetes bacterium]|nr:PAS domain S-box protein [Armatimonadota bacterium]
MAGDAARLTSTRGRLRPLLPDRPVVHLTPRGHAALWYGLAILLVAATGFLLWHPQFRLAKAGVYHPFMPAVLLAACGGGLGPGLAATLLGAIVASGVLIPPLNQMGPETPGGLLNLLVFLGCGSATSFLCELFWEERMGGRETVLKLAQSEERCRRLLETTGEGVWILDPEGRLQFMNPRLVELLGHPVHELQGVHLLEFVPAEERAAADRFRQRIQDGEDFQAELPLRREDGKILQGQVHSAAIRDVSGRVLGSLGMVSDLSEAARLRTELRDASRRVVTILENVQDGFLSLDREYRVTYASPSAAALLGCTSSELRGVPVWESVPELVGSEVEAAIRGAGAAGPSGPLSFHHTGVERWIEC